MNTNENDSGTLKFSKPTPNFPKGGEEIKDGEFVSSVKEETKQMRIFITESEVLELAVDSLDLIQPNPDRIHEIAERMDMVYNEDLDLFEDVEEHSLRRWKRVLKENQELKALLEIAHQYVTVFLIRGEDPLAGEQIKDHSYKILKALGRSI